MVFRIPSIKRPNSQAKRDNSQQKSDDNEYDYV